MGKLYGIGVGVGDPELITLKAIRALKESDVVILPRANTRNYSTAYEIAKEHLRDDIEKIYVDFTTVDDDKIRELDRIKYAKIVNEYIEEGKTLSFITIGDPMTYSTFVYVINLIQKNIEIETIPGITSFASVAARLNTPLVMGDETLKIVSVSKETDLVTEINSADNLIFMKITRDLERLKNAFKETDCLNKAVLISNCGKDEEKIIYNIENITKEDISYFSTILLKKGGIKNG